MIDHDLLLCDDQDLSQAAGTYVGTNTLKLAEVGRMGAERRGEPMEILIQVTEAFASGGAATVDIQLATGNTNALGSPQVQLATGALALTELTLGRKFRFPLVMPQDDADATHVGVQFVIATATTTFGRCSAWIQPAGSDQDATPRAA